MGAQKVILVIDDEEDIRDTVEFKLKSEGYKVETAVDGVDGLEKLKNIDPDLIILDMNMPRMGGLEFYNTIRGDDDTPNYPVLVLTARANMEQLFKELDVDGFMAKPFEFDELIKEAGTIIKRNSGEIKAVGGQGESRLRKVCIIDNDNQAAKNIAMAFLETGYMVNLTNNGASAIKHVVMAQADIALVKLHLTGIQGDMVVLKLKKFEATKRVKCILYNSADGEDINVKKRIAEKVGIQNFVPTNDPERLIEAVDELFNE